MIRAALPIRQNETARRSAREIPRDMGPKPPTKTQKPRRKRVEYELRIADGGQREGNLLVAMMLFPGDTLKWDGPVPTAKNPAAEVELYIGGVLKASGFWPNLTPA